MTLSFVIASMGTGFGGPTFMIMYQNAIPQKQLGAAVVMLSLFRQFGASVGTALAGLIVGARVVAVSGLAMAPFVQQAFVLPFAGALAVLLAAWFTTNVRCARRSTPKRKRPPPKAKACCPPPETGSAYAGEERGRHGEAGGTAGVRNPGCWLRHVWTVPIRSFVFEAAMSQIAYVGSDDHVYIAEADGSNPRQVTRQVAGLSGEPGWTYRWPTYSPDGRRLAFAGYQTASASTPGRGH